MPVGEIRRAEPRRSTQWSHTSARPRPIRLWLHVVCQYRAALAACGQDGAFGDAAREVPEVPIKTRLSGLEALNIDDDSLFVNVGERTNVTGSKAFLRLIREEKFDEALAVARQQVENGAQIIDIKMDEAMLDSQASMRRFLNLVAGEPEISRVPILRSLEACV